MCPHSQPGVHRPLIRAGAVILVVLISAGWQKITRLTSITAGVRFIHVDDCSVLKSGSLCSSGGLLLLPERAKKERGPQSQRGGLRVLQRVEQREGGGRPVLSSHRGVKKEDAQTQ